GPAHRTDDPRPRRLRRLRGRLAGAEHAAHPADVGHERHPRHRAARRALPDRAGRGISQQLPVRDRDLLRDDQRGRRLPRDGPHARDVQAAGLMYTATFLQDPDFIRSLYIVAFALFILDLRLMNHPRTARRGNVLGAIGMGIAVIATLLIEEVGDYGLIALGIAVGTAVGVPAARPAESDAQTT